LSERSLVEEFQVSGGMPGIAGGTLPSSSRDASEVGRESCCSPGHRGTSSDHTPSYVRIVRRKESGLRARSVRVRQKAEERATPSEIAHENERSLGELSQRLALVYRVWVAFVLGFLAIGTLLDLLPDRRLATETVPFHELPASLLSGNPAALETTAVLLIMLGPIVGLLTIVVSCAHRGDRFTALLALLVLTVVVALPIARTLAG
jgi:hypothetical protein